MAITEHEKYRILPSGVAVTRPASLQSDWSPSERSAFLRDEKFKDFDRRQTPTTIWHFQPSNIYPRETDGRSPTTHWSITAKNGRESKTLAVDVQRNHHNAIQYLRFPHRLATLSSNTWTFTPAIDAVNQSPGGTAYLGHRLFNALGWKRAELRLLSSTLRRRQEPKVRAFVGGGFYKEHGI